MTTPDLEAIEARLDAVADGIYGIRDLLEDQQFPEHELCFSQAVRANAIGGELREIMSQIRATLHAATQERDRQAARVGALEKQVAVLATLFARHCRWCDGSGTAREVVTGQLKPCLICEPARQAQAAAERPTAGQE